MKIKNVTIAGGGTLGSQIAWQTANNGFNVTVYDKFEEGLEKSKAFHKSFADLFLNTRGTSQETIDQTNSRLSYTTNLKEAVKDADLISESVPEKVEIKKSFYTELAKVAPEKTIFTTNSSTTLPSQYAEESGRPEKFLALHFANGIWDANIGEVMGHPGTDPNIFDQVMEFAKNIGMVPIPIHKEQNGYILNSLLVPFLTAGLKLLSKEISDVESIDKTWMIGLQSKIGPFGILDMVGMKTAYDIGMLWGNELDDKSLIKSSEMIKENYMDKGNLGVSTGKGFYTYPNPKYNDPDFLI